MNYIENAVALRRELHQIPELGWENSVQLRASLKNLTGSVGKCMPDSSKSVWTTSWAAAPSSLSKTSNAPRAKA